jgi:hypothetical protein
VERLHWPLRWSAWHNFQPGANPTIYVVGELTFASTGYRACLKKRDSQNEGVKTLVLDLLIEALNDSVSHTATTEVQEVRYEQQTNTRYHEVGIYSQTRVPVQIVS